MQRNITRMPLKRVRLEVNTKLHGKGAPINIGYEKQVDAVIDAMAKRDWRPLVEMSKVKTRNMYCMFAGQLAFGHHARTTERAVYFAALKALRSEGKK